MKLQPMVVVLLRAFNFIFQSYRCTLKSKYIDKTAKEEEETKFVITVV